MSTKPKKLEEVAQETKPAAKHPLQAQWDAHVAHYIAENPVKGAAKKARGEFDKIPDSFRGFIAR